MAPLREIIRKLEQASPKTQLASAVAVREREAGGVEFLLVRTSSGERWTFPKGHRDHGETLCEAAAREALEEAGVSGRVEPEPFAHYRYPSRGGGWDVVAAFRLQVEHEGVEAEARREPAWYGFEAARSNLAAGRDDGFAKQMERVLTAAAAPLP